MRGFVYAISAGPQRHKIGRAGNPKARLQSLQCGVPDPLALVHAVEVGAMQQAEAAAHERLRDRHVRGEWFDVTEAEAVEALNEIARAYPPPSAASGATPASDARTTSDLGTQALALMVANMAGRYGVLTRGAEQDALPFAGEALIMEASWRLLQSADGECDRFFGPPIPDNDEEDGSL